MKICGDGVKATQETFLFSDGGAISDLTAPKKRRGNQTDFISISYGDCHSKTLFTSDCTCKSRLWFIFLAMRLSH
jgi:hypothetical protein